ncbi:Kinesin-like protein KIF16B [Nymphon striatum]|nr:Kinesin-like protein KIF16B [Nymphon striatum]
MSYSLDERVSPLLEKSGALICYLSEHYVDDNDSILNILEKGNNNRSVAATQFQQCSSRGHAIFTLHISMEKINGEDQYKKSSKIHLVDLAGSERANTEYNKTRLKEGANINKSLVTLGSVISTLAVSPSSLSYHESLSTLRYAHRAKCIVNKPVINEDPNLRIIRELRLEIAQLKSILNSVREYEIEREREKEKERERVKDKTSNADLTARSVQCTKSIEFLWSPLMKDFNISAKSNIKNLFPWNPRQEQYFGTQSTCIRCEKKPLTKTYAQSCDDIFCVISSKTYLSPICAQKALMYKSDESRLNESKTDKTFTRQCKSMEVLTTLNAIPNDRTCTVNELVNKISASAITDDDVDSCASTRSSHSDGICEIDSDDSDSIYSDDSLEEVCTTDSESDIDEDISCSGEFTFIAAHQSTSDRSYPRTLSTITEDEEQESMHSTTKSADSSLVTPDDDLGDVPQFKVVHEIPVPKDESNTADYDGYALMFSLSTIITSIYNIMQFIELVRLVYCSAITNNQCETRKCPYEIVKRSANPPNDSVDHQNSEKPDIANDKCSSECDEVARSDSSSDVELREICATNSFYANHTLNDVQDVSPRSHTTSCENIPQSIIFSDVKSSSAKYNSEEEEPPKTFTECFSKDSLIDDPAQFTSSEDTENNRQLTELFLSKYKCKSEKIPCKTYRDFQLNNVTFSPLGGSRHDITHNFHRRLETFKDNETVQNQSVPNSGHLENNMQNYMHVEQFPRHGETNFKNNDSTQLQEMKQIHSDKMGHFENMAITCDNLSLNDEDDDAVNNKPKKPLKSTFSFEDSGCDVSLPGL